MFTADRKCATGETFFHEVQQLASEGYGVIMLNPRGGNGYGQALRRLYPGRLRQQGL
ncbi:MAG: prolyl oligopeptidase family serine peptidase [Alkalibacterium sp.]|nr:prolyl oligopeptidase family serine peptidase [Alkalibacterium sp.]